MNFVSLICHDKVSLQSVLIYQNLCFFNRGRNSDGGEVKSGMIVCYVDGLPPPLTFLPPPSTWPLFSAVPAPSIQPSGGFGAGPNNTDMVMARNVNGSGRKLIDLKYISKSLHAS